MRTGLLFLVLAYILSQFYRSFLAVMSPVLAADIGARAEDLSRASGLWFLAFACMQLLVGAALDRVGPRLTAAVLLTLGGGGGAAVFAMAQGPAALDVAMVMIGIGCSPVLMASYYIFARMFRPAVFATLAGALIGVGSLGNLAGSLPMAWAVEVFGWRGTMWGLCIVTLLIGAALFALVQNPPRLVHDGPRGSVLDLLKMPVIWAILPMMFVNYAPAAGIRGLWIGPYLDEVFGLDAVGIGRMTLVMGLAMIAGNFIYGPLDRIFGSRKWVILVGNLLCAGALLLLAVLPAGSLVAAVALMSAVGFFGASFPLVVAHARSFFPPHMIGRGVTLLNLFGIGGAGLMQLATGRIYERMAPGGAGGQALADTAAQSQAFAAIFLFFALAVLAGCLAYLWSRDSTE